MTITDFLNALYVDGRVSVSRPNTILESDERAAVALIEDFEGQYRLELPGEPPKLIIRAAIWAARQLYQACQFAVFRDFGDDIMPRVLQMECDSRASAEDHYSVDLTFRFLPDLIRLTRCAASEDPLLQYLMNWARRWPLSSVGIEGVETPDIERIMSCSCLSQVYVDRIIHASDAARLQEDRVRRLAQASLGAYPDLAPKLKHCLTITATTQP